ncbi:MAG: ribulose-phosphate 3-epimerase [Brevinematia bacterium]
MRNVKIAPSIFASNFLNLKEELENLEKLGVDYLHYDIMDNHFVPNISFGPLITKQISEATKIPGDVHLMIDLSEEKIKPFFLRNIEFITLHLEAPGFSRDLLKFIKENGKKPGISVKPSTPPEEIEQFLDLVELVLVMTVEPGFSGQTLISETIDKIGKVREILEKNSKDKDIYLETDGGISLSNIRQVVEKGANLIVMGSFFFRDNNGKKVVDFLNTL